MYHYNFLFKYPPYFKYPLVYDWSRPKAEKKIGFLFYYFIFLNKKIIFSSPQAPPNEHFSWILNRFFDIFYDFCVLFRIPSFYEFNRISDDSKSIFNFQAIDTKNMYQLGGFLMKNTNITIIMIIISEWFLTIRFYHIQQICFQKINVFKNYSVKKNRKNILNIFFVKYFNYSMNQKKAKNAKNNENSRDLLEVLCFVARAPQNFYADGNPKK